MDVLLTDSINEFHDYIIARRILNHHESEKGIYIFQRMLIDLRLQWSGLVSNYSENEI